MILVIFPSYIALLLLILLEVLVLFKIDKSFEYDSSKFTLGGRNLRGFNIAGAGPRNSSSSYTWGNNILISQRILWRNNFRLNYLDELSKLKVKPIGFSVDKNTIYKFPEFFLKAKKLGFKTYVYNINVTKDKYNESKIICELSNFIYGIYAEEMTKLNKEKKINCY